MAGHDLLLFAGLRRIQGWSKDLLLGRKEIRLNRGICKTFILKYKSNTKTKTKKIQR